MQELFRYVPVTPHLGKLGKRDMKHSYSDEVFFSTIRKHLASTKYIYAIGITRDPLEQSSFNRHDKLSFTSPRWREIKMVGIITVARAHEFTPWDKTLEQYLAYLLLCESFCLSGRTHFEHDEAHSCLFDECGRLEDLLGCLEQPHLCKESRCEERLREAGFTANDIVEANTLLNWIEKPSLNRILYRTINNPLSGFLGGLIVGYLGSYMASLPAPYAQYIVGALLAGFLVSVVINLRSLRGHHEET
jgi:hypothetical protein